MKDIKYYKENKLKIPFELTKSNKVGLNDKVIYTCKKCNIEYSCKYSHLLNREVYPNECICYNCINKLDNHYYGHSVPEELKQYSGKDNPIPWDVFTKYKDDYTSKKWISIKCQECGEEAIVQWSKISSRKYAKNLPICSKCISKYTANLSEWKDTNSKAQLIAQNKPETKEKIRNSINDKIKNDIEFRRKITRYSGKLSGYYKGVKFDSSWELSVLYYYGEKIKPCEITIPYIQKDGSEHLYLPDFELYDNNKKHLLEVKGEYREIDYLKIEAAKNMIKNKLIDYDDLIIIDKTNIKQLKGIIFFDSKEKLKIIKEDDLQILKYPKNWK